MAGEQVLLNVYDLLDVNRVRRVPGTAFSGAPQGADAAPLSTPPASGWASSTAVWWCITRSTRTEDTSSGERPAGKRLLSVTNLPSASHCKAPLRCAASSSGVIAFGARSACTDVRSSRLEWLLARMNCDDVADAQSDGVRAARAACSRPPRGWCQAGPASGKACRWATPA